MFGPHQYGERPAFLAQLEVTYTDGSTERVVSGTDWRAAIGPVTSADIMSGEEYDARLETDGWTRPGFDDGAWVAGRRGRQGGRRSRGRGRRPHPRGA